jgi:hypothetical protein
MLLSALLMASCAAVTPTSTKLLPPASLLADCPAPAPTVSTNGELVDYILALRGALRLCNDDKAALREWAKD